MKKSELRQIIKEEIQKLNEYFVKSGDKMDSLFVYNLFGDMLEDPIDGPNMGWAADDDLQPVKKIVGKYRPIAKKLKRRINKVKKYPIPNKFVNVADNFMYDGSDAYDSPVDTKYLPAYYDKQISFVEKVLGIIEKGKQ